MEFNDFKKALTRHLDAIFQDTDVLFYTDVEPDILWETYLGSFPPGTNEIYRVRSEHDCSCCRQFIKRFGNVVTIKDNIVHSIWDGIYAGPVYGPVCEALSALAKSRPIAGVYLSSTKHVGTDATHELAEDGSVIRWEHLYVKLPQKFVVVDVGGQQNLAYTGSRVFKRSLEEITDDAVETVLELISEKALYRGEEWANPLSTFLYYKRLYSAVPEGLKDNFVWEKYFQVGPVIGRMRSHSIGVLLTDISTGMDLDEAVTKYERIVAPTNYKRPKAIFTKKMLDDAKRTVTELGYIDSLPRRFATLDDITVNNILFADRSVSNRVGGMDPFDLMEADIGINPKNFSRVTEMGIENFLANVLPSASSVEVLLEDRHKSNLVSLIAPVHSEAPSMFKWNNPFSWAYTGNITDSLIRENVKNAGGDVDGVLRFSIQWNDKDAHDNNDLDAHCRFPNDHIYYMNKSDGASLGKLDVDIMSPDYGVPAVENITWPTIQLMPDGDYDFWVHCYACRGGKSGFRAEIAFDGHLFRYDYSHVLSQGEDVKVATVHKHGNDFTIKHHLPCDMTPSEAWGVKTNQFVPVSVVMNSPNYWDDQYGIGNKHYFFMLKGCINPEQPNGFFNEYLKEELVKHKRVFAALGEKMAVAAAEDQLSGVGFSSTKHDSIIVRVQNKAKTVIKVVF